ncbi:MAG TPA: sodium-dependent transporter [Gammaproteobacteria bacterium]|nr:sodium-dependent transporter [Gammaproteobacteria bacterium]
MIVSTSRKSERLSLHGLWSSRTAFVLAATGSAVGLGNIWRFPYVAGENGGGIFVLLYVACIFLIGIPIMMTELMLGRRGRRNPLDTMRLIAVEERHSPHWVWIGRTAMLAGLLILSYYSVIAGWIMAYIFRTAGGVFHGMQDATEFEAIFSALIVDPERLIAWHSIFMVLTVAIVAHGIERGLERAVKIIMPALCFILLLLLLYAATTPGFIAGLKFMFSPDISKLNSTSVLFAMGMAFFSLSLGTGAIMMYGSYLPKGGSIGGMAVAVALADTLIALLAGVAIFSIVFANGLEPTAGPGLVFITLPVAFAKMPMGTLIGVLFFILLLFTALASAIALLEPWVAWLVENKNQGRIQAACICGLVVWILGLGTVFSFNLWADYKWTFPVDLGRVRYVLFEDKTFFNVVDFLTSNILLPLGGLLTALFTGHLMRRQSCQDELQIGSKTFNLWYFVLRNISPIAVGIVFLHAVGVFKWVGIG